MHSSLEKCQMNIRSCLSQLVFTKMNSWLAQLVLSDSTFLPSTVSAKWMYVPTSEFGHLTKASKLAPLQVNVNVHDTQ